ncbi:hypothetical protein OAE79_00970 [Rhodopirellula sp.]|nr:hypothetical protein [Rhodopirellula sp.]MDB4678883.1 hypothetical protein [Rhodopirellula sp.]
MKTQKAGNVVPGFVRQQLTDLPSRVRKLEAEKKAGKWTSPAFLIT